MPPSDRVETDYLNKRIERTDKGTLLKVKDMGDEEPYAEISFGNLPGGGAATRVRQATALLIQDWFFFFKGKSCVNCQTKAEKGYFSWIYTLTSFYYHSNSIISGH